MAARSSGPVFEGQRVTIECEFRVAGGLRDPLVIQCTTRTPSGGEETMTYPDADLVRVEAGKYEAHVTLDQGGTWWFRFAGHGGVEAVSETYVEVEHSHVTVL